MTINRSGVTRIERNIEDPTTGDRVTYDADGVELSREPVTGLTVPTPDPYAVYAAAIADAQTMEEVRAAGVALAAALAGGA